MINIENDIKQWSGKKALKNKIKTKMNIQKLRVLQTVRRTIVTENVLLFTTITTTTMTVSIVVGGGGGGGA